MYSLTVKVPCAKDTVIYVLLFSVFVGIPYTVRVSTGDKEEHATEASAFVVFIGTDGVSDKISLELIGKTQFEPKSIETFSLEAADLGDIKKIEVCLNLGNLVLLFKGLYLN